LEEDNFNPDCDNIKKNIKSFTEDMLREEEYKAFLDHLETCSECKKYVRSVDSFSNQLWRLGDVKVPSDFGSTVLFKLTQPEEKPDEEETSAPSKKWLIGGIAFILVAITLSAGLISYFKLRKPAEQEITVVQAPVVSEEAVQEPHRDQESDIQFDELDGIAAVLNGPKEEIAFGLVDLSQDETASEPEVDLGPTLLHWHFNHYDKTKELDALRLRRQKRKLESDLKKSSAEPESAKSIEEEISQVESRLEQNLVEKRRREGEPSNILKSLGIRLDYQDNDFVFFTAWGDQLKNVLDEIDQLSVGSSSLKDFTPGASNLSNKEYKVSVYVVKKETAVLHWHVHLTMLTQKMQLLRSIQENGGDVTYEFAEEVTFSISSSKIEKIRAQMPAMRISLSEFGSPTVVEGGENDESVVISIYFSR